MKVSVMIPVYNSARYLPACLDSLTAQTLRDWEALLVDDGSTDGSQGICREYCGRDSRLRLLCQQHKGVSAARNLALEAAAGEWLFFLDSDDAIHPRLLEELLAQAEAGGSGMAFCLFDWLRGEEVEAALSRPDQGEAPRWRVLERPDALEQFYSSRVDKVVELSAMGGKLIRRELAGGLRFEEALTHGEDTLFLYRVLRQQPRVCYTTQRWYYYRRHSDSLMGGAVGVDFSQWGKGFRMMVQEEYQQGRLENASRCQQNLCMTLTDRIFLAREAGRKDVARELRGWLLEERRHPLYRGRSFTCKTAVFLCLYGYPLFHLVKLAIRWLRKAVRRLECR